MHVAVYVTVVVAAAVGPAARLGCRRLAPRPAALVLSGAAVIAAAGWAWGLALLVATLVDDAPTDGAGILGFHVAHDPVPVWVGALAATLLAVAAARAVRALAREHGRVRAGRAAIGAGRSAGGGLLVVTDPRPLAFAVPSLLAPPGRVVVSTALLRALDAEQRAFLLAHERSHLRNRHSWMRAAVALARAVLPLLRGTGDDLDAALERWADEDAVAAVADRQVAARSVGRAALAALRLSPREDRASGPRRRRAGTVTARVSALSADAPRSHWLPALGIAALVVVMAVTTIEATGDLESLLDPGPPAVTAV